MHQALVVGIDEHKAVLACEVKIEFCLGLHHPFETTKPLKVSTTHIGDQPAIWVSNAAEEFYLAWVVGPHLHNGKLRTFGNRQKRQRHPHVIVEVAFGSRGFIPLGQHGMHQFLGGGLAIGASDAYDGLLQVTAVLLSQLLQRLQHVGNDEAAVVDNILRVTDDTHRGPLLQCLRSKGIAIEMLALEGKEDTPGGDGPRVGSDGM